jgi:hypothetical protein
MTSSAKDCWRLSGDCSRWAVESRDNAARLAFRQMATAWAQLAFNEEFTSPAADEDIGPPKSESSEHSPVENAASSSVVPPTINEKGGADCNPAAEVDVQNYDQPTRGSTDQVPDSSWQNKRLSLPSRIPSLLVGTGELAITGHVRRKNGRELAGSPPWRLCPALTRPSSLRRCVSYQWRGPIPHFRWWI